MHECEDLWEELSEEYGEDEEGHDVYMQDEGQSEEYLREFEEDQEGSQAGDEEEFLDTCMVAWHAKKRTAQHRLQRGFSGPKVAMISS